MKKLTKKQIIDIINANPDKEFDVEGKEILKVPNMNASDFESPDDYQAYIDKWALFILQNSDSTVVCQNEDIRKKIENG